MEQIQIKHNETGRSMVEMLGVLAIVGVLSIGGVAGYRYAVDKMNANEIINELRKQAITASQQRVLGQNINLSEYGVGAKIEGTYTVTPTTNYDGNASQFALEVAGVPERVCDMIIDSDWALPRSMAVNGGSCIDGANGNTMTFAFNNTLGSGNAGNGETPDVTTEATETEVSETDEVWTDLDETATETETETETETVSPEASVSRICGEQQILGKYGDCYDCSSHYGYDFVNNPSECTKCDDSGYKWVLAYHFDLPRCMACSNGNEVSALEDDIVNTCKKCGLGVNWNACSDSSKGLPPGYCHCAPTSQNIGTKPNS